MKCVVESGCLDRVLITDASDKVISCWCFDSDVHEWKPPAYLLRLLEGSPEAFKAVYQEINSDGSYGGRKTVWEREPGEASKKTGVGESPIKYDPLQDYWFFVVDATNEALLTFVFRSDIFDYDRELSTVVKYAEAGAGAVKIYYRQHGRDKTVVWERVPGEVSETAEG